ncbi:MAG: hypothetical protein P1P86_10180, partial [Bacteroidales bacterium]|nr:hypothetical protein [Bacteroidales bacterium]
YWKSKISNTKSRDRADQKKLKEIGWNVHIIWECELKRSVIEKTLNDIYENITSEESTNPHQPFPTNPGNKLAPKKKPPTKLYVSG